LNLGVTLIGRGKTRKAAAEQLAQQLLAYFKAVGGPYTDDEVVGLRKVTIPVQPSPRDERGESST
jgi:hypothetical protein